MATQHTWTREDDILVFYIYRFGESVKLNKNVIAKAGMSVGAVTMRVRNCQYIKTGGKEGLARVAKLTESVPRVWRYGQRAAQKICEEILNKRK